MAVAVVVMAAGVVVRRWEHDAIRNSDVVDADISSRDQTIQEAGGNDSQSTEDTMKRLRIPEKGEDSSQQE